MQSSKTHIQMHSNKHKTNQQRNINSFSTNTSTPNNPIYHATPGIQNHLNITLYDKIYAIQPQLASKITGMLIDAISPTDILNLLNNPTNLQNKINEAIIVLIDHQSKLHKQHTNMCNTIKSQFSTCTNQITTSQRLRPQPQPQSQSVISSGKSTPILCSVPMTDTASISNSSINYSLSSVNNQSVITKFEPDISPSQQQITPIETKTDNTQVTMPSICTMRTVRMIVNAPLSKPMLQIVIQQQCILNPKCFQKIYVRCHKSYYHQHSTTVTYIHFVNFTTHEYIECKDKLFNFDYNSTNIIGLMGNQFGIIQRLALEPIKEYKMIRVPVEYLSKMVNICLRCKWNEAENRKRVCKYCISEEINDRNKIADYYNNIKNKVIYKNRSQIESDLINLLKIEPYLVPGCMYSSPCKSEDKCSRNNCTWIHNKNEKHFGWQLSQIQKSARNRRYYKLMNQYELNDYQIVALNFKYRQIICNYYEKHWKYNSKLINDENTMKLIVEYLNKWKVKLHLIPLMYKSICREERCRIKQGKFCYFVHLKNDRIFGDMLFKIKCMAKDKFETESNGSMYDEKDEMLFGNDIIEEKKENECNLTPWQRAINPYMTAVDEEREAEITELNEWSLHSTNISVKIETVNKCNNKRKQQYELYVIYEDDKDAKIIPFRTYVDVLFPCEYEVGLRTYTAKDNKNVSKNKKRLKSCPACYFNVCNDNEHWQLHNNTMVLRETDHSKSSHNDEIQGVVVEKLESINANKNRYKVRIEKYGGTDFNITCWLKFAMVASNRFNKKHRKDFDGVHVSYLPSGQYYKIKYALKVLGNNEIRRTDICKMIFGIDNTMPMELNDYNVKAAQIRQLFPRLNDSQVDAICGSLKYNMHMIQGPPATGKTSICAHIAYLWWKLNGNSDRKIKIHGLVPTNKGCMVLAQKCKAMSKRMIGVLGKNKLKHEKPFKVLYFAANHCYPNDDISNELEEICVNVMAENKLRQLNEYKNMNKHHRKAWKDKYIFEELVAADMIVTTLGNAVNKLLNGMQFSHAICDELNQGSLDTFLGVIRDDIKQLTMAGDIQQLAPVIKSNNLLAKKSVYEDIISYLTNKTNRVNKYYTRLLIQYRSHPQIYGITTKYFYDNTVDINDKMYEKRDYGNLNYGKLFVNKKNHIQWHMYEQTELDTSKLNQSKCNKYEAHIVLKYVKKFIIELGNKERHIAIVSDYKAQIEYMKTLLCNVKQIDENEILLCTTNQIEGSSKPIVIYMCVRSNNSGSIGFLNDNKRVNVALSRAEYGQIIVGDINTLQYNPIYNKIFQYHMEKGAVVCENNTYNKWNSNSNWIKKVETNISLINISNYDYAKRNKRNDYHICSGCGMIQINKLFCGRSCNKVDFCEQCMNKYLYKYGQSARKLTILSKIIIDKSQFFAHDANGISIEFDTVLGKYLMDYNLIIHIREQELTYKLCNVAVKLWNDINRKYRKYIPKCFAILVDKYYNNKINFNGYGNEKQVNTALGIMRCKRNHLLQQNIMDTRFFQIVNKIRHNNNYLKQLYNANVNNKYTFYLYKEFVQYQPTTVIVAYLQCCGYKTHISNRLRTRIGKQLSEINKNNPNKYKKSYVIPLDQIKMQKFAHELYCDQSTGIKNVLSTVNNGRINDIFKWSYYVIELMQQAVIEDTMGPYYHNLTHISAINAEMSFGEKLTKAGFSYIAENELKEQGFKETPDYYLKKPWIVNYNDKKVEITWLDFKNQYCSATEWNIDHLNRQAHKYNEKFGVGAFVFSLGFVKPPKGLQLNCYGLLAAVPLSKHYIEMFIETRMNNN